MKGNKNSVGNQGGRPEKYTEDWLKKEAIALLEWIKQDENDPNSKIYLGSFALQRGYHRNRLAEFKEKSAEFACAYQQALIWQEQKFIHNGLTRKWDPGFTQFVMARVCSPEFKKSWDQPEERVETPATVIINKIEK